MREFNPHYQYKPDDPLIRENLLEHIGVLPMVATTFYPYIDEPDVDLGQALIMLAIHDTGELTISDVNTFIKEDCDKEKELEREAAFKLLDPSYHDLYIDVEGQTSKTAKFAKSVDKVAADILDYLTPVEITVERFDFFVHVKPEKIVQIIIDKKRPYMLWNAFMADFHTMLVDKFSQNLEAYLEQKVEG